MARMLSLYFLDTTSMTLSHNFPYFFLTLKRLPASHRPPHGPQHSRSGAIPNGHQGKKKTSRFFLPPPETRGVSCP